MYNWLWVNAALLVIIRCRAGSLARIYAHACYMDYSFRGWTCSFSLFLILLLNFEIEGELIFIFSHRFYKREVFFLPLQWSVQLKIPTEVRPYTYAAPPSTVRLCWKPRITLSSVPWQVLYMALLWSYSFSSSLFVISATGLFCNIFGKYLISCGCQNWNGYW